MTISAAASSWAIKFVALGADPDLFRTFTYKRRRCYFSQNMPFMRALPLFRVDLIAPIPFFLSQFCPTTPLRSHGGSRIYRLK